MKCKMISIDIVTSNKFSRMSEGAQFIYYVLIMHSDGMGFIDKTYLLSNMYDYFESRMQELINNEYIHKFNDDLYLIMDWPIHNNLKKADYLFDHTIYTDELYKLDIQNKKRYRFLGVEELLDKRNKNKCDDNDESTANNTEINADYEKKCELLRENNIVVESKKGKEILNKCTLDDIKKGIDYALNHLPKDCQKIDGYIVNCILGKVKDQRLCPECKGKGKIESPIFFKDEFGYEKCEMIKSDCPVCKGAKFISKQI